MHRATVDRRTGVLTPDEVLERYEAKRADVIELADEVGELAAARQRGRR